MKYGEIYSYDSSSTRRRNGASTIIFNNNNNNNINNGDITYPFSVVAAIFDLPVTRMSESVHFSPAVLLDPDIVGVGLEFRRYLVKKLRYCVI